MELLLLIILLSAAALWINSLSARELAISHGAALAERCNLQLLDETVACQKITLGRNRKGHAVLQRTYVFEVSANGADRMACHLTLRGQELLDWHIPPYLQTVH